MSLALTNISFPFIALTMIITPLLSFILIFFLIKDHVTKKVLLRGPCRGGLYPIPSSFPPSFQKYAFVANKLSYDRWHARLGHSLHEVVRHVVHNYNLSCSSLDNKEVICDACLRAKAHQLPYLVSTSRSSFPLELVFSDVWGPAINSFGGKKYYVSFIDDCSKFT
jgi:hypothetical protein